VIIIKKQVHVNHVLVLRNHNDQVVTANTSIVRRSLVATIRNMRQYNFQVALHRQRISYMESRRAMMHGAVA
jgi:hypothetical protein